VPTCCKLHYHFYLSSPASMANTYTITLTMHKSSSSSILNFEIFYLQNKRYLFRKAKIWFDLIIFIIIYYCYYWTKHSDRLGLRKACVVARKRKGKNKESESERSKKEMKERRWCEWHAHAIIMFIAKPQ